MTTLGPGTATLRVLTRREGLAARAGHDLVLEVGRWEATLDLGPEASVHLTADGGSLEVVEGHGGAVPLSDRDRRDIVKNVDAKVLRGAPIVFRSTSVSDAGDGRLLVDGELELVGTTGPARFELRVGEDGSVHAEATVTQSRWGIKPYSGLMGALKVADDVRLVVDGRLP